jgi:hypothetical protein
MEAQLEPLQNEVTSGAGKTLIVPEPARIVQFLIRSKGSPTGGQIQIECCPMKAPGSGTGPAQMIVWREMKTVPVPHDIGVAAGYYAGKESGMFRPRISTPISGGTVSVWPLVAGLIGNTEAALEPVVS